MSEEFKTNPFTLVYSGLWDLLLQHPRAALLLREGNQIRFDVLNNRDPLKQAVQVADLPEIILTAETISSNLLSTSSSSSVTRGYAWLISTGDFRYTPLLAQIEWMIFVAMSNWKRVLAALTWKDAHFVKKVNISSANAGFSDAERNRGIQGWSAAWRVEVEMHFRTADLTDELLCVED